MKRLLIIDDDPNFTSALERLMKAAKSCFGQGLMIATASSLKAGNEIVESGTIDVVLLDLTLGDSSRAQSVEFIRHKSTQWPAIIVISGCQEQSCRIECLAAGAMDYIQKGVFMVGQPEILLERCMNAYIRSHLKADLQR